MRSPDQRHDDIAELERRAVDSALAEQIDMTIRALGDDHYRVASADGSVEFRRVLDTSGSGRTSDQGAGTTASRTGRGAGSTRSGTAGPTERYEYEIVGVEGTDPVADGATDRFVGLDAEVAGRLPDRTTNSFPHAFDQIAQFFDSPFAPDLMVQHTAAHRFGPNLGEHGSLGVVQARAPFIASGAGVNALGVLPTSARMVDVAPTLLHLLGAPPHPSGTGPTGAPRADAVLARQDGDALTDIVEHGGARHVVVILLDGCNANVLADAMATGAAPTIAQLAAAGTSLGHGLFASLPTATLANHTTANTGAHPGHSGVVHNMWHDRERALTPDLLAMDQMFDAMVHLRPDVETLHEAVHRFRPDAFTTAFFEFCDRGADVSSFADFRSGRAPSLPQIDSLTDADADMLATSGAYAFMSTVDELATRQAVDAWRAGAGHPLPDLTFLSLALTDEAGHEGGPHGDALRSAIADSDRRVARVVDAVDTAGALAETAFVVIADHGMEGADPANDRPWDDLVAAVVPPTDGLGERLVDVAHGWWYLRNT